MTTSRPLSRFAKLSADLHNPIEAERINNDSKAVKALGGLTSEQVALASTKYFGFTVNNAMQELVKNGKQLDASNSAQIGNLVARIVQQFESSVDADVGGLFALPKAEIEAACTKLLDIYHTTATQSIQKAKEIRQHAYILERALTHALTRVTAEVATLRRDHIDAAMFLLDVNTGAGNAVANGDQYAGKPVPAALTLAGGAAIPVGYVVASGSIRTQLAADPAYAALIVGGANIANTATCLGGLPLAWGNGTITALVTDCEAFLTAVETNATAMSENTFKTGLERLEKNIEAVRAGIKGALTAGGVPTPPALITALDAQLDILRDRSKEAAIKAFRQKTYHNMLAAGGNTITANLTALDNSIAQMIVDRNTIITHKTQHAIDIDTAQAAAKAASNVQYARGAALQTAMVQIQTNLRTIYADFKASYSPDTATYNPANALANNNIPHFKTFAEFGVGKALAQFGAGDLTGFDPAAVTNVYNRALDTTDPAKPLPVTVATNSNISTLLNVFDTDLVDTKKTIDEIAQKKDPSIYGVLPGTAPSPFKFENLQKDQPIIGDTTQANVPVTINAYMTAGASKRNRSTLAKVQTAYGNAFAGKTLANQQADIQALFNKNNANTFVKHIENKQYLNAYNLIFTPVQGLDATAVDQNYRDQLLQHQLTSLAAAKSTPELTKLFDKVNSTANLFF